MSGTGENKTFICPEHGAYTGETRTRFWGGEPRETAPECPECGREREKERQREEAEAEKLRVIKKWRSMNIGERYYEASFDNFDAYNGELRGRLETCRAFAEKAGGHLIMVGGNGTGKTHLAVSILKKLGGAIYTAFEIGLKLRQSYNGGGAKEHEVFEELCSAPLLVIDEVEKIKDSESKQNWMSYITGKRYNRMLPMILIANCHTQNDCTEREKPCPRCLESDVISRIAEGGRVMKFDSGDYRRKIREAGFRGMA
jgi:DNA replication protein DnaC